MIRRKTVWIIGVPVCVCCFLVLIRFRDGGGRNNLLPWRALGGCQRQFPLPEADCVSTTDLLLLMPMPKAGLAGVSAQVWAPLFSLPIRVHVAEGPSGTHPSPSMWSCLGSCTGASVVLPRNSPKGGHGGLRARQQTSQIHRRLQ